jgi:DUF1365 family protein
MIAPSHIAGVTFHGRKGAVGNRFRYGVDYLLVDAEGDAPLPWPLRRNRPGLIALHDADYGGVPGQGRGAAWVRETLARSGLPAPARIALLAQPRVMGHVFNPAAFWLCLDADGKMPLVVTEVTNTYGDRHAYLCHRDDLAPLTRHDVVAARKVLHVSPFQPDQGAYTFRFDIRPDRVGVWIDYTSPEGGLYATLTGRRVPLRSPGLIGALLRRPLGSRRVLALIHWQALVLWLKGVRFRPRPPAPGPGMSR